MTLAEGSAAKKRKKGQTLSSWVELELVAGGKRASVCPADDLQEGEDVPAAVFAMLEAEVEEEKRRNSALSCSDVHVMAVALSCTCIHVSSADQGLTASSGQRLEAGDSYACRLCPFRSFSRRSALQCHLEKYHVAAKQHVVMPKQLPLVCAMYEQKQAAQRHFLLIHVDVNGPQINTDSGCFCVFLSFRVVSCSCAVLQVTKH